MALAFAPTVTRERHWFVAAVASFFLALASPIGVLARGYLFSAHMLQHLLLLLAVPPLVLLGLPAGPERHAARRRRTRRRRASDYAAPWLAGVGGDVDLARADALQRGGREHGVQWLQTALARRDGARVLAADPLAARSGSLRAASRRSSTCSPPASRAPCWGSW